VLASTSTLSFRTVVSSPDASSPSVTAAISWSVNAFSLASSSWSRASVGSVAASDGRIEAAVVEISSRSPAICCRTAPLRCAFVLVWIQCWRAYA